MKRVQVNQAEEGAIIAADIFDPAADGDLPLIRRGVCLTPEYIEGLKNHGINNVLVETPPGYKGKPGEVLAPLQITEDILFDGKVEANCNITPQRKIEAAESVIINGNVAEGCIITSATGNVIIRGAVEGTDKDRIKISAARKIIIEPADKTPLLFSDIKTVGEIAISCDVHDSTVAARGKIKIKGRVNKGQIYTQSSMRIAGCGDATGEGQCHLIVKPYECRKLFQALLQGDAKLETLQQEKDKLLNVIELIKRLGKNVEQLPQEKKMAYALQVKRFQTVEKELTTLAQEKIIITNEIQGQLGSKRIRVAGPVYPNTKVSIENSSMVVTDILKSVAFSIQNFKVVSTPLDMCGL